MGGKSLSFGENATGAAEEKSKKKCKYTKPE
jgi:hypothetical protein